MKLKVEECMKRKWLNLFHNLHWFVAQIIHLKLSLTIKEHGEELKNVPYNAEFVDPEVMEQKIASGLTNDPENPIYLKDGKLKDKMKTWVQYLQLY